MKNYINSSVKFEQKKLVTKNRNAKVRIFTDDLELEMK